MRSRENAAERLGRDFAARVGKTRHGVSRGTLQGLGERHIPPYSGFMGDSVAHRLQLGHERRKKKSRALPGGAWLPAAERREREGSGARACSSWAASWAAGWGRNQGLAWPPGRQGGLPSFSFFLSKFFSVFFSKTFFQIAFCAKTNKIKTETTHKNTMLQHE